MEEKRNEGFGAEISEPKYHNVFDEIMETGHDEEFVPSVTDEFCPTDAPAGSPAKVKSWLNASVRVCPCGILKTASLT